MRIFLALATTVLLTFSSCMKADQGCKAVDPKDEESKLLAYASAQGFTATKHNSGLYYQVVNQGSGATPTLNSYLTVHYTGKFLDGTVFDQTTTSPAQFPLAGVIEGWKIGLPLIQKGGSIRLLIPSALAYGCTGSGPIAPNTPLVFEVQLIDVQ